MKPFWSTQKLPTWQHVNCPNPNCYPNFNHTDADPGCSRYRLAEEPAPQVVNSVQLHATLECTGCGHKVAINLWLRAKPRGKRSRPARSVEDL